MRLPILDKFGAHKNPIAKISKLTKVRRCFFLAFCKFESFEIFDFRKKNPDISLIVSKTIYYWLGDVDIKKKLRCYSSRCSSTQLTISFLQHSISNCCMTIDFSPINDTSTFCDKPNFVKFQANRDSPIGCSRDSYP